MAVERTTADSTTMGLAVVDEFEPDGITPMPVGVPATNPVPEDGFVDESEDTNVPLLLGSSQETVEVIVVDPRGI